MPSRKQLFSVICGTFVCYVVIYHIFRLHQYSTTTCSQVQFPIKELVAMLKFMCCIAQTQVLYPIRLIFLEHIRSESKCNGIIIHIIIRVWRVIHACRLAFFLAKDLDIKCLFAHKH